ncbi:hypothetical protein MASR2M15_07870 [Anaerolineales bacterium]
MKREHDPTQWLEALNSRGWSHTAQSVLDIIEPVAPVLAQMLWISQPMGGIFGKGQLLADIAHLLESKEGISEIRSHLIEGENNRE